MDTEGRAITFDIKNITFANIYPHLGSDHASRVYREKLLVETLPNLLTNRKSCSIIGGDWNYVNLVSDYTIYYESQVLPGLKCLVSMFALIDSHKVLTPCRFILVVPPQTVWLWSNKD